jgi:hypothetical protein
MDAAKLMAITYLFQPFSVKAYLGNVKNARPA